MKYAVLFSVLFHFLILVAILPHKSEATLHPTQELNGSRLNLELLPPVASYIPQDVVTGADDSGSSQEKEFCVDRDKNYVGIGFTYDPKTKIILSVPPSYPAYKAGIRIGDYYETWFSTANDGVEDIHVLRGDTDLSFQVNDEHICFKNT